MRASAACRRQARAKPDDPRGVVAELARSWPDVLHVLERTMKAIWIVSWRGLEEECSSVEEALDRWDELDARGIRADVFEVIAGARRKVRL